MFAMRFLVSDPNIFRRLEQGQSKKDRYHFVTWYNMVKQYSNRALTMPSDKLIAIAGLARLMQENFRCQYGAGLWKEDLWCGLAWVVNKRHGTQEQQQHRDSRDTGYVAPSWSWASVVGLEITTATGMSEDTLETAIQVLGWEFSYPPGSSGSWAAFGQIPSGTLTVTSNIRDFLLLPYIENLSRSHFIHNHLVGLVNWPAVAIDSSTTSACGTIALDSADIYEELMKRYRDVKGPPGSIGEIGGDAHAPWLLEIAMSASCIVLSCLLGSQRRRYMTALVLAPVDEENQIYHRIGLLRLEWPASNSPPAKILEDWVSSDVRTVRII